MQIDGVLLIVIIILSFCLGIGMLLLAQDDPKLFGGIGDYTWDRFVEKFSPKRNFSIFEDPEDENE